MKIIIAGAGAVGFHLAQLLSNENQDITLIDMDDEVLAHASSHLDVLTIKGDAASIYILEEARVKDCELFLAVTTSEKTNLLLGILAKQLGAKKTVVRVNNPEYLEKAQVQNFNRLGIDTLISPQVLAAQEIKRLLKRGSFTDVFEFEEGKISAVGLTLDNTSPLVNREMKYIKTLAPDFEYAGIAILRGHKTIIPRSSTRLNKGDHLYLSTKADFDDFAKKLLGEKQRPIKRIMIIGGTDLAYRTAQLLENDYNVTVILKDKSVGKIMIESLHKTLVVIGDYSNIDILKEEGLVRTDSFIALTPNSETNILTSLMAEKVNANRYIKTIALVDSSVYTHISQNIGIDTIINKKLIAANNIFRFVRKGQVEAIASLHGVEAEMIEFVVHNKNGLCNTSIRELNLPKKAMVAGVVRDENSFIPDGDFVLKVNDKVIVFTLPETIHKVEEIFN